MFCVQPVPLKITEFWYSTLSILADMLRYASDPQAQAVHCTQFLELDPA